MTKWLIGMALLSGGGCTYLAATPSVAGHAYVVRNEYVSSSYWNCEAPGGDPVCYQTKKIFQPKTKESK
jgi:hypothetical protein